MNSRIFSVSAWILVSLSVAVFLLAGLSRQGFWEDPSPSGPALGRQVPRLGPEPENTEIARVLQLEEAASTRWPLLTQWLLRGAARLGTPEIAARLPSLAAMGLLALLMVLFLRRHGQTPQEPLFGLAALGTAPVFLVTARTVNPDALPILFHTLFVILAFEWVSGRLEGRVRGMVGLGVLASLLAAVLSGGWFWGAAVTPGALFAALFFSRTAPRRVWAFWGIFALAALAVLPLLHALDAPVWLAGAPPNPASAVPAGQNPHALFTIFWVRVFFSAFPVSLIALLGFFTAPGAPAAESGEPSGRPAPVSLRFFAGWLTVTLLSGAYWEMRVETALFLGIFPLCAAAAVFLARHGRILLLPVPALLLALGALLVFRDFATYPQILPEFFTMAEIPSVQLRLGPAVLPAILAMTVPLLWVLARALRSFPEAWSSFWKDSRVSPLFRVITLPLRLAGAKIAFLWRRRPMRGAFVQKICMLARSSRAPALARALFFLSIFSFGGWFSLHVIPGLVREFSSRPAMAAVAVHAASEDGLGVYEASARTAPLYAGRSASVLSSENQIAAFMSASERNFLVFPSRLLGKLDSLSRARNFPYHLLQTDSLAFHVAVNRLPEGVADANPLRRWIFTEPPKAANKIQANLENALELVGYDAPRQVARGEFMTVRLVFRVDRALPADNQVFIHLDPPYGTRITADHDPVQGLLPTRYFSPGTYVVDEYTFRIPRMGFPAGRYGLFAGLFSGNNRVKVVSGAHAGQNRIPLGFVDILPARWPFSCR